MLGSLKTIGLYVEDQDRSLSFYESTLGFEVRRKLPMAEGAFWIEVAPPGSETCLAIYPRALVHDWANMRPSLMFECADVMRLCEELTAKGVTVSLPPAELPWGVFAAFEDPDGNTIGITSPSRTSADLAPDLSAAEPLLAAEAEGLLNGETVVPVEETAPSVAQQARPGRAARGSFAAFTHN